jgi:lipoprotein-releasing system permease protein
MRFPFFVSRRFTFSRNKSRFLNLISTISVIGISLGVAVLIIALSILSGFEKTILKKVTDFDSHIQITSFVSILPNYHVILPRIENELSSSAVYVSPFVSKLAIIGSNEVKDGVNVKGERPGILSQQLNNELKEGNFNLDSNSIIIGKKLADKLRVKLGDKVTVFALLNDKIPSLENPPNVERFYVSGIFESGMSEYDDLNAYVNLKTAQNLFGVGDNVTGYDIKLKDISKIDALADRLDKMLGYPHYVKTIYQMHRNLFTWIELQKKPIPIILALIILVAVFNMIGTLLMIVLEKTNAVGTLMSLGATSKQIIMIFLNQGAFLTLTGIIIGNILAYALMAIQMKFNIITLPSSVYFVSTVPFLLTIKNFFIVSGVTFILGILASFVPSYISTKINVISTLRFN